MAKGKQQGRKAKAKPAPQPAATTTTAPSPSSSPAPAAYTAVAQLLAAAIAAARAELDACNPAIARDILVNAATANPDAVTADLLELLGFTEMELAASYHSEATPARDPSDSNDEDGTIPAMIAQHSAQAEIYFRKAVELGRDRVEPATYLYLGQLCLGAEAVAFYEMGIKGLEDEIEILVASGGGDEEEEINSLKRKISSALCSMTEIYMTDCCDDPLAEQNCTAFTARAQQLDPASPEVHQTRASVLLSRCLPAEAAHAIADSLALWSLEKHNTWPAYPTRLASAKILMEVGSNEEAAAVLETVLKENDEDLEVWYLFSWCYYRMGGGGEGEDEEMDVGEAVAKPERSFDDKVDCWLNAKECLEKLLELAKKDEEVDPNMLQHASDMLQEVSLLLAQHPEIVKRVEDAHQTDGMMGEDGDNDEMEM